MPGSEILNFYPSPFKKLLLFPLTLVVVGVACLSLHKSATVFISYHSKRNPVNVLKWSTSGKAVLW